MEQNQNPPRPEAATDEPASFSHPGDAPGFAEPPLVSDTLGDYVDDRLDEALGETFPPGARKPRHDGWGPEQIAAFLRELAATGVVEHAARRAGRSPQSAYNFRNGRRGRAFARVWDAVLVNRARARLASDLQGRALAGCVSVRKKDGEIVSEYHYYDNRLSMSVLTRLDRLAEKEAPSEAHLRALSEDYEDYIDCVAAGGDADAFVEDRRPPEPEPVPDGPPAPLTPPEPDTDLTAFARAAGCPDLAEEDPRDVRAFDLNPLRQAEWTPEQWLRAFRSGFMAWLAARRREPGWQDGPGAPWRYEVQRDAVEAVAEHPAPLTQGDRKEAADLDPAEMTDWSRRELALAHRTGLLGRLPHSFWDDYAVPAPNEGTGE